MSGWGNGRKKAVKDRLHVRLIQEAVDRHEGWVMEMRGYQGAEVRDGDGRFLFMIRWRHDWQFSGATTGGGFDVWADAYKTPTKLKPREALDHFIAHIDKAPERKP